jgi:hypothetical protein
MTFFPSIFAETLSTRKTLCLHSQNNSRERERSHLSVQVTIFYLAKACILGNDWGCLSLLILVVLYHLYILKSILCVSVLRVKDRILMHCS